MIPEDRRELLYAVERAYNKFLDVAETFCVAMAHLIWFVASVATIAIPLFYAASKLGVIR